MRVLLLLLLIFLVPGRTVAQGCFPDRTDTIINLDCNIGCTDLIFRVPDLRQTTEYKSLSIPYQPFPFEDRAVTPIDFSGAQVWPGNAYSAWQDLPFEFCFFDSVYTGLAVGANGCVSFDSSVANKWCEPFIKKGQAVFPLPSGNYARALIAGVMHDLDPGDTARVSPESRIELRIEGSAPCRKAIISYYRVPLWPGPQRNCQSSINTHQIVIYEGTGIIDVFVKDSPPCSGSNQGLSIMGLQNFDRDVHVGPRSWNAAVYGSSNMNEAYRFLPSGGASRLISTHLYLNGREVMTGGAVSPGADGELQVEFADVCPGPANNMYIFKAVYASCTGGSIELYDTAYVNKTNNLNATATSEAAYCTSSTGSITVELPPGLGTPPFEYSLNGGVPQASNIFSGLAPGNYLVTVNDATGCSSNVNITVGSENPLTALVSVTPTSCNGASDGTITIDAGRGLAPISYSLNGGTPQASHVFTGLAAGNYAVLVTDAAGCTATATATIQAGAPLFASFTKTDISCYGLSDGSITIHPPVNGLPPYEFSLDGVNYTTSTQFNNLPAGDYIVRYHDSKGCTGQMFVFLAQPQPLNASIDLTNVSCNGLQDGRLTVNATGGTAPYEYSVNGSAFQSSPVFDLPAGNYVVNIRDSRNCSLTLNAVQISEPELLQLTAQSENAGCAANDDGRIIASAEGGNGNFEFSIDGVNFQQSPEFFADPGTYQLTVRDGAGCTATEQVVVGLTDNLELSIEPVDPICEGNSVRLDARSNAEMYSWQPPNDLDLPGSSDPLASPRTTTEYTLTASLGRCTAEATVTVTVLPAPVADAGEGGEICLGNSLQLNGTGGTIYSWSPDDFLNDNTIRNPIASPQQTTTYSLSVTDVRGCRSLLADTVTIHVIPPFTVVTIPSDTIVQNGDQVQLQAFSPGTSYIWDPPIGLNDPFISNPVATVQGSITYTVTAITDGNCRGEGQVILQAFKGPEIYVPTAFTPNGDGKNDVFRPFSVGITELKYFMVYNRWGRLVFKTTTLNEGWDGSLNGQLQPGGVYVWMVQGVSSEGNTISHRGTVTLIR